MAAKVTVETGDQRVRVTVIDSVPGSDARNESSQHVEPNSTWTADVFEGRDIRVHELADE